MAIIRPATPGFIVTLVATILLAIVSFCVPYFKSVYFLKASISVDNYNGSITFGTLGYCLELSNGTSCSKPSVGYEIGECSVGIRPQAIIYTTQTSTPSSAISSPLRSPPLWSNGSHTRSFSISLRSP